MLYIRRSKIFCTNILCRTHRKIAKGVDFAYATNILMFGSIISHCCKVPRDRPFV